MLSRRSLSVRIGVVVGIVTITSFLLLAVTAYFSISKSLHADLKDELSNVGERLQLSMVEPLWSINPALTESILRSELKARSISAVVVDEYVDNKFSPFLTGKSGAEEGEFLFGKDEAVNAEAYYDSAAFEVVHGEEAEVIGRVSVFVDDQVVKSRLRSSILGLALGGVFISVIIQGFLMFFISRMVIRPVSEKTDLLFSTSGSIGKASHEISNASDSLATGASEQAASLEEISSSMEEMTSMVTREAEVAARTNEQSLLATQHVTEGVESTHKLKSTIDAVSLSAKEMEKAMTAIMDSSSSISKIIKTIDEIAFQTNILALNAAVEAARAGEAGAGFAVVADEVRNLAQRAADAARETASMIEDSIQRSDHAAKVNSRVNEQLNVVLESAKRVESSLTTIDSNIVNVKQAMDEVEASVKEQQEGIIQINSATSMVNDVTQQNAASAEETASSSREMNSLSNTLMEIVGTLKVIINGKSDGAGLEDSHPADSPRTAHEPRNGADAKNQRVTRMKDSEDTRSDELPSFLEPFDDFEMEAGKNRHQELVTK